MWMRSPLSAVLCASAMLAQPPQWSEVQALRPGTEVLVETASGESVEGRLSAVSSSGVWVGRDRSIPRESVRKLSRREAPARRKLYTGIGTTVGLMAGLLAAVPIGFKQCGRNCNGEGAAMVGLVVGGPVGGALLGRKLAGKGEWWLVYYWSDSGTGFKRIH